MSQYHPNQPYPPYGSLRHRRNGMGTTGLVLGIVALALSWVPVIGLLSFLLGALGVIFGSIGIAQAGRGLADNMSSAIAGVVTSILAITVRLAIYTAMAVSAQVAAGPVVLQIGETADVNGLVVSTDALHRMDSPPVHRTTSR